MYKKIKNRFYIPSQAGSGQFAEREKTNKKQKTLLTMCNCKKRLHVWIEKLKYSRSSVL